MDCPRCMSEQRERVRLRCYYSKNYGTTTIRRRYCRLCHIRIETSEDLNEGLVLEKNFIRKTLLRLYLQNLQALAH